MTYVTEIITAIAALLNAAGKPANLVVLASRQHPSAAAKLIKVFPVNDSAVDENAPRHRSTERRALMVGVLCRCDGTDIDNEALRAWVVQQMFLEIAQGNLVETLGGLAVSVREGDTDWHGELDSKTDLSHAVMQFMVEYSRPKHSLEYPE